MAEIVDSFCVKESDKIQEKYTEGEQEIEVDGNDCLIGKFLKKRKLESCEDMLKKKKKKFKKGELSVEMIIDGRVKRVVFDFEGNFERVENIQEILVNITKESYMKIFMFNYIEKIKIGGSEKQSLIKKVKIKKFKDNFVRVSKVKIKQKSEESFWSKLKQYVLQ